MSGVNEATALLNLGCMDIVGLVLMPLEAAGFISDLDLPLLPYPCFYTRKPSRASPSSAHGNIPRAIFDNDPRAHPFAARFIYKFPHLLCKVNIPQSRCQGNRTLKHYLQDKRKQPLQYHRLIYSNDTLPALTSVSNLSRHGRSYLT